MVNRILRPDGYLLVSSVSNKAFAVVAYEMNGDGVRQGHLSDNHPGFDLTTLILFAGDHHDRRILNRADESVVQLTGPREGRQILLHSLVDPVFEAHGSAVRVRVVIRFQGKGQRQAGVVVELQGEIYRQQDGAP